MGSGIEIPSHEVIIFNLNSASADRFLEQHSPSIFFVREQFVDGFPIPSGPAGGGRDVLSFQTSSNFSKAITSKTLLKYPTYYPRFIGIHYQLTIRINIISISSLDKGKQKTNNIIGCQPYTKHRFQQNRSGVFVCVLDIVTRSAPARFHRSVHGVSAGFIPQSRPLSLDRERAGG